MPEEQRLEQRLRRMARRQGYQLRKNPSRTPELPYYGGFMIVDERNCVVAGAHPSAYCMTLGEVWGWLEPEPAEAAWGVRPAPHITGEIEPEDL
jgi:hypothetical protein